MADVGVTPADERPYTTAGSELLDWCDRVQYDDRNRERILRIEADSMRDALTEFGQWLTDNPTRLTDLSEAIEEDAPELFVAIVDGFLNEIGGGA